MTPDQRDAARYRKLRALNWHDSLLCVVSMPKNNVKLGSYCPSNEQLDELLDNMLTGPSIAELVRDGDLPGVVRAVAGHEYSSTEHQGGVTYLHAKCSCGEWQGGFASTVFAHNAWREHLRGFQP